MIVEFWLRDWRGCRQVEAEEVFKLGSDSILLVETQDELDYCFALQFVLGGSIPLEIWDGTDPTTEFLLHDPIVTTWDPTDRNRI